MGQRTVVTGGTQGPLARDAAARRGWRHWRRRPAAAAVGPCRLLPPPVGWIDQAQPRGGGRRGWSLPHPERKPFPLSGARTPPKA